jgi:cytochrome c oxidase subunit III
MATRVTSTRPAATKTAGGGPKPPGPNGKGPSGNGHWGGHGSKRKFSAATFRITLWVILAAVVMMFAALSSAYLILSGGEQWRPVTMPRMFYLSTGTIVLSSFTFEAAKRYLNLGKEFNYLRWLGVTLFLGLAFLVFQLMGWRELAAQGVYLKAHPHRSFFYIFTAVHGVHLAGGIIALIYLISRWKTGLKKERAERTNAFASVISLYWHMMDGLWLWLFALLLLWR